MERRKPDLKYHMISYSDCVSSTTASMVTKFGGTVTYIDAFLPIKAHKSSLIQCLWS